MRTLVQVWIPKDDGSLVYIEYESRLSVFEIMPLYAEVDWP